MSQALPLDLKSAFDYYECLLWNFQLLWVLVMQCPLFFMQFSMKFVLIWLVLRPITMRRNFNKALVQGRLERISFVIDLKLQRKDFANWRNISYWFPDWVFFQGGVRLPTPPIQGWACISFLLSFLRIQWHFILLDISSDQRSSSVDNIKRIWNVRECAEVFGRRYPPFLKFHFKSQRFL